MEDTRNSECWYINTCEDDCGKCIVYPQMKWQMENSGLPKAKQKAIQLYITEANPGDRNAFLRLAEIRKNIVDFVQAGKNLYICGEHSGNGKTSWAIKMLHTYFHHTAVGNYENLKGMFVSVPKLLLQLKDFSNPIPESYKKKLETVDLVVWDDVAVSGLSQYDYTQLFMLIDMRMLAEKANIFTSNVVKEETLATEYGNRLTSRIYHGSEIIELTGKDMR